MDFIRHINHSQMKVVAMTAHDSSILEELQKAGFDNCLFKPFRIEKLQEILGVSKASNQQVSENKSKAKQSLFAPFLAFAGDDPEAEAELIQTVKEEMSHYESTLKTALTAPSLNTSAIGMAAHKLLPIATMLQLDCLEPLQALAPEHIQELEEKTIREYTLMVINCLENLRSSHPH